ncbi:helix-turn-helix protein [compost metagenome]
MVQARDDAKLSERMGGLLFRLREARKLSQREAAKQIGISQARLVSLEHGHDLHTGRPTLPSPQLAAEIARVYHYPKDLLLLLAGHCPWFLSEDEANQLIGYITGKSSTV